MLKKTGLNLAVLPFSLLVFTHGAIASVTKAGLPAEGLATVMPSEGTAGQFGTWTVTYTVGKKNIQAGGGIRVQLPDEWHSGSRNFVAGAMY